MNTAVSSRCAWQGLAGDAVAIAVKTVRVGSRTARIQEEVLRGPPSGSKSEQLRLSSSESSSGSVGVAVSVGVRIGVACDGAPGRPSQAMPSPSLSSRCGSDPGPPSDS